MPIIGLNDRRGRGLELFVRSITPSSVQDQKPAPGGLAVVEVVHQLQEKGKIKLLPRNPYPSPRGPERRTILITDIIISRRSLNGVIK